MTFPFPRHHLEAEQNGPEKRCHKEKSSEKSREKILRLLSESPRLTVGPAEAAVFGRHNTGAGERACPLYPSIDSSFSVM